MKGYKFQMINAVINNVIKNRIKWIGKLKAKFSIVIKCLIGFLSFTLKWSLLSIVSTIIIRFVDEYKLKDANSITGETLINTLWNYHSFVTLILTLGVSTIVLVFFYIFSSGGKRKKINEYKKNDEERSQYKYQHIDEKYFENVELSLLGVKNRSVDIDIMYRSNDSFLGMIFNKNLSLNCEVDNAKTYSCIKTKIVTILTLLEFFVLVVLLLVYALTNQYLISTMFLNVLVGTSAILCFLISLIIEGVIINE